MNRNYKTCVDDDVFSVINSDNENVDSRDEIVYGHEGKYIAPEK